MEKKGSTKKRIFSLLCACALSSAMLAGCGSSGSADSGSSSGVPDLTGTYKQTNSNSEDTYQTAAIDDDTITIYWYTAEDQTTALYWSGTFVAPTGSGKYSWDSENYHELTDSALLASGDDTKTITYDNGELSYEVSMLGVTSTITLEKSDDVNASTQKPSESSASGSSEGSVDEAYDSADETSGADSQANGDVSMTGDTDDGTGISSSSFDEEVDSGETAEEVSEQLDITAKATKDGQVAVFITNNSQTVIDELEVKVNYLDDNNMVIDQSSDGHDMILPGHTVVSKMDVPSVEFADAQVEYNLELGRHSSYVNHSDDVTVTANPGDGCVMVQITNNSDVSIDEIEYDVVLFSGDDIVTITYPEDVYELGAGQSTTEKVDVYSERTYENFVYGTDYDRIEVYLNQAHTFGY